jgi:hypothetical protein
MFGLLLRLVRAGECRVGHDPTAHGCLAALRALGSRERPSSAKGHFRELSIYDDDRLSRPGSSGGFGVETEPSAAIGRTSGGVLSGTVGQAGASTSVGSMSVRSLR